MDNHNSYIPAAGDIIWLDFDPAEGHEQKGRRPGFVASLKEFSKETGFAMVCPITNTFRPYPTRIQLDNRTETTGYILCEQAKSLDYKARKVRFREKAPQDIAQDAIDCIISFFE